MALEKDDLQAIAALVQGIVKAEIEPLKQDIAGIKSDMSIMQDDITDIKVQLNQIDTDIIKTRQQVLREARNLHDVTDAAFEEIGRIDNKVEQHISDSKHIA